MTDETDDLGMALSKFLFEREPKLLVCDADTSARVAAKLANLMGCCLAVVLAEGGIEAYARALEHVEDQITKSAIATISRAQLLGNDKTEH